MNFVQRLSLVGLLAGTPSKPAMAESPQTEAVQKHSIEMPDSDIHANAETTATELQEKGRTGLEELMVTGFVSQEQVTRITNAATNLDSASIEHELALIEAQAGTHDSVHEATEGGHNTEFNKLTLLMSYIALLWFAAMIVGCLRGNEVSFIKHHSVFVLGLIAMATQAPGHVLLNVAEGVAAFTAIMTISRGARGITNKVDFNQVSDEEAKTLLVWLGPLASLITTPAFATIMSPLRDRLMKKSDKYRGMHSAANTDGGAFIGDFPFLYVWMQKGITAGIAWQAGVMAPIMLFNKLWQAVQFKVGPMTSWKHKDLLWKAIKGFRFEPKRLTEAHDIRNEEMKMLDEFLIHVRKNLSSMREELGPEVYKAVDVFLEAESVDLSDKGTANLPEGGPEMARMQQLQNEIETVLSDDETQVHFATIVAVLRRALADGKITATELEDFEHAAHLEDLVKDVPGLRGTIHDLNLKADGVFQRICEKLKFSHNEAEIGRVFTAQALAIGLLIPAISHILSNVPVLTEVVGSITTGTADNYAACALTWATDNAKAVAISIVLGASTIFGNMANLNWLGKDANFKESVLQSRHLIPVMAFMFPYLNDVNVFTCLGVGGVAGAMSLTLEKILETLEAQKLMKKTADAH